MSYLDLKSGEIYGHILWGDEHGVIFWTEGRESLITADEFAADLLVAAATEEDQDAHHLVGRFQVLAPLDATTPQEVTDRRDQLAGYAARNGNVVHVHQPHYGAKRPRRLFGFLPSA